MKITMRVPKSAVSSQEGTLAQWHVEDGATVETGQPIYSIEMEKATMAVDAPFKAQVHHIATVGESYAVGEPICELTKL